MKKVKPGQLFSDIIPSRIAALTICLLSVFSVAVLFSTCAPEGNDNAYDELYAGFQNPSNEYRPRVWWHWMNGNVTKDGIRKDLLWMHRSGIGGFHNFDAGLSTPQIVDERLQYMTPAWKDAFGYTVRLADSLKMEVAIAGSPGWSESGGPWVELKDGMKKLVWREMRLKGGQTFNGKLPEPFTTTGAFQNIPQEEEVTTFANEPDRIEEYYQDVAVIAYRLPEQDISLTELNPKVTSSGGRFTLSQLTDGDLSASASLPANKTEGYAWIQFEFPNPQLVKALTVVGGGVKNQPLLHQKSIEASDDGVNFREVTQIPSGGVAQQTICIPPTKAKYFRVKFGNPEISSRYLTFAASASYTPPQATAIAELVLHPVARIHHAEEKAGFASAHDLEDYPTPPESEVVEPADVMDLTDRVDADGNLRWEVPAGEWKITRFGYSLTGKKNHPASPEATGLEVDKMDARAVKDYFNAYLDQYRDATGGLMGERGLQYLLTDSYEAGQETWTPLMAAEFEKRRGYSLYPWLPVLTGQIIGSVEISEKFLWDWRKTISELIAENHYDQLTTILRQRGMKRYTESHEGGRPFIADGMDVKRTAAVPMSAIWMPSNWAIWTATAAAQADIRESASVAHIYGQNLVAAESFTAFGFGHAWSYSPETLKPVADLELANGLNRFVIHTSVHQPADDKVPGLGLNIFGQWFNRHETWAEQAKVWTDYLARSSYMLQQGKFVADIVYYYGEDNCITGLFELKFPDIPRGYNYDFINSHALLNLLSAEWGKLVTPSGMSYRMLVLDKNVKEIPLAVLTKIARLAKEGAVICGARPELAAGLMDDQAEFDRLTDELCNWPNVHIGATVQQTLSSLNIKPDFEYASPQDSVELLYVHRKLKDGDIYWVNNRSDSYRTVEATFRVTGKKPQIWHPETGGVEDASYSIGGEHTAVTLNLTPKDAVFVVFAKPADKKEVRLPVSVECDLLHIEGAWTVAFQQERGAPENAVIDKLSSYTEHADKGIKYFSGTATYSKTIHLSEDMLRGGKKMVLDLGDVKNLAEITVNGAPLGVVWKTPFRVDVTNALHPGENSLEIKVVNLWVNRLIGDLQPNVKQKITYTTIPFYTADSPLLPSGLLGPVRIISVTGNESLYNY